MPVYEYICKACEHEFEREQRISDKPAKKCPSCGALKAKRQISRTSFVLKGGGWYSDLYASPGSKKEGDAAASASGDAAGESAPEKTGSEKSGSEKPAAGKKGAKEKTGKGAKAAA